MTLLANWRTYVVLLILSLGGWGGWQANTLFRPMPPAPPPPVTNTITVERVVTRTVTVIKRPDGTVEEVTTETTADTNTNTSKPTPVVRPKWSAEAIAAVKPESWSDQSIRPRINWSGVLYHRVGDTNLWAGGGYDFGNRAALLAVRVDF